MESYKENLKNRVNEFQSEYSDFCLRKMDLETDIELLLDAEGLKFLVNVEDEYVIFKLLNHDVSIGSWAIETIKKATGLDVVEFYVENNELCLTLNFGDVDVNEKVISLK